MKTFTEEWMELMSGVEVCRGEDRHMEFSLNHTSLRKPHLSTKKKDQENTRTKEKVRIRFTVCSTL